MYHGQGYFTDHNQPPWSQHGQPWSTMVDTEKQWYHGHPEAGVVALRKMEMHAFFFSVLQCIGRKIYMYFDPGRNHTQDPKYSGSYM